jgi:hypothetical protein
MAFDLPLLWLKALPIVFADFFETKTKSVVYPLDTRRMPSNWQGFFFFFLVSVLAQFIGDRGWRKPALYAMSAYRLPTAFDR